MTLSFLPHHCSATGKPVVLFLINVRCAFLAEISTRGCHWFSHACSLQALACRRVPNGISPGCLLLLPVGTVNYVRTLKAGPVDLSWAKENVAAIISAGYGGEFGGQAIADVLTGVYNPGGALPYTLYTQHYARCSFPLLQPTPLATNHWTLYTQHHARCAWVGHNFGVHPSIGSHTCLL
jgi:hypothetical protein